MSYTCIVHLNQKLIQYNNDHVVLVHVVFLIKLESAEEQKKVQSL